MAQQIETREDLSKSKGKDSLIDIWRAEIENSEKYHKESKKEGEEYLEVYENEDKQQHSLPIFWSNTQVLRPFLFSKLPKTNIIQTNYNDDEVARIVSELIERVISYFLKESDIENIIEKTRDSFLIKGIGIPKITYIPPQPIEIKIKKIKDEQKDEIEGESKDSEEETSEYDVDDSTKKIKIDYIDYEDFLKSTEKEWGKLRWVAFRKYFNRTELIDYFGSKGEEAKMTNKKLDNFEEENDDLYKLCEVWEIWDKESMKVYHITFGGEGLVLDITNDPYKLKNFFPVPMPMGLNDNLCKLLPVPLYRHYKNLCENLNTIHDRIISLVEQAKFTGIYTKLAEQDDIKNLMNAEDGVFSPMQTTANIDDAKKLVLFKPILEIANTITILRQEKLAIKADIQEITGLSDIVRGYSIASETATAQQIKGNFAISRIQPLQKEVEYTIRDTLRLLAEMAVEQLSLSELMLISGLKIHDVAEIAKATQSRLDAQVQEASDLIDVKDPERQKKIEQLHQQAQIGYEKTMQKIKEDLKGFALEIKDVEKLNKMLKTDKLRSVNIDIETDSTVKIDQNQEKQERIAYIQTISAMVQAMGPVVQSGVITKESLNEFIIFASKPFKVGRNLENFLKNDKEEKQVTPQEMVSQMELQMRQQDMQMRQMELQIKQQEIAGKLDIEQQKVNIDKAKLLNQQNEFEQKLEYEDVNKQADREAKRLDIKVKASTETINDQIRNANKSTMI
jgi:hypothetical protein